MKRIAISLLLTLLLAAGARAADGIRVKFDVRNATAGTVALVHHVTVSELPLTADGKAECRLSDIDAVYAKVYYGEQFRQLYLQSGDEVTVSFDAADFAGTFAVSGGNERAIDYLNKTQLLNLPDDTYALPYKDFLKKVEEKTASMLRLLKVRKFGTADKFAKMEEGRITYFYASALLMYPVGHLYLTQDTAYTPDAAYYKSVRKYVREDADLVDVDEYRAFIVEAAHILDEANRHVRQIYPKTVAEMNYIGEHYKSDKVRQALIHHLALTYVEGNGTDNISDLENVYYAYVTSPALLAAYRQARARWDVAAAGRPSPDFTGVDIDGRPHTLRDFRGKYVYIDMWATWCAPCRKELPFLKQLAERFAGRNICFLGLSIDEDKAKWEARVRDGGLCGTQLHIGSGTQFQRDYKIGGIPHFILLDPLGRIVSASMTRPSSADTERILNSLQGL